MKKLIVFLMVTVPLFGLAQKVEVEKNKILVDDSAYAIIEKDGCGALSSNCEFNVKNLAGKKVLVVKQFDFTDPDKKDIGNPEGKISYLQFVFLESKQKAEIADPALLLLKAKDVAKKIVKAELFKDGELDAEAVNNFVLSNGKPFSDRKKELAQPKVIIIEKKEDD